MLRPMFLPGPENLGAGHALQQRCSALRDVCMAAGGLSAAGPSDRPPFPDVPLSVARCSAGL